MRQRAAVDKVDSVFAYCSWCFQRRIHLLKDLGFLSRNIYLCSGCGARSLPCRACQSLADGDMRGMARGHTGWDDELCAGCTGGTAKWGINLGHRSSLEGWCSWCLQETSHRGQTLVYKCSHCEHLTTPCANYDCNHQAFARLNGSALVKSEELQRTLNLQVECLACQGFVDSWEVSKSADFLAAFDLLQAYTRVVVKPGTLEMSAEQYAAMCLADGQSRVQLEDLPQCQLSAFALKQLPDEKQQADVSGLTICGALSFVLYLNIWPDQVTEGRA